MKSKRLQGLVTAGRWTLPAAIFICTLCWVLTSALLPELTMTAGEEGGSVLWQSARTLLLPAWAEHLVSFLIYAAIGYFLIELNNRFSIIRMRASVQTAIYFLLVTVCPEMHLLYAGNRHNLFILHLFPVQELPAVAGVRISVLLVPVYRCREHSLSPAHLLLGALVV